MIAEKGGVDAVQKSFIDYYTTFLFMIFASGFLIARREIRNEHITILLSQPLSVRSVVLARFCDLLGYILVIVPLWLGSLFIFLHHLHQSWYLSLLSFTSLSLSVLAASLLALACAVVLNEKKHSRWQYVRFCSTLILVGLFLIFFLSLVKGWIPVIDDLESFFIAGCFFCVSSYCISTWSFISQVQNFPEDLYLLPHQKKGLLHAGLLSLILVWVPKRLKCLVRKDLVFASRYYKTFYFLFAVSAIFIAIQVIKSIHIDDAMQWLISLNILASYLYANFGFKFSQIEVEDLRIPRILPVSSAQYWWAKFWINFLPVLWIILFGHILLVVFHRCDLLSLVKSFLPSLGITFTLLFVQNNFALYSYPYSRYSALWYNLYIILAVTFFTVFLFPPLAVVFLIFGYVSIFRVLRRYEAIEVTE